MNRTIYRFLRIAFATAVLGGTALSVSASTVTVLADINATDQFTYGTINDNEDVFLNILGDSTNVLFSRNVNQQNFLLGLYDSQDGVDANARSNILPNLTTTVDLLSAPLSSFDLLVVTPGGNDPIFYTPEEMAEIISFSEAGGDIFVIAEAFDNEVDFDTQLRRLDSYNAFLDALGSDIRYDTSAYTILDVTDQSLAETPISSASDSFRASAYNTLTGGTSVASDPDGRTFLAFQDLNETTGPGGGDGPGDGIPAVPLPASLPLMLGAGAFLFGASRRKTRAS